jgi:protein-tyrosine phosphatase
MKGHTAFVVALALGLAQPVAAKEPDAIAATAPARIIPLAGARNFRDVGGYRTSDGHQVRWAALYRSGSLANLAPAGMARLQRMHIRAMIDLRMTEERRRDRNNWLAVAGLGYWTRDYRLGGGQASLAQAFGDPATLTSDRVRSMMMQGYRTLPKELAPQYREIFVRLIAPGTGSVVVNCTAGKDRTGIATALVLTALGVPYKTVREDFLLSNAALDMASLQGLLSPQVAALPPEIAKPLLGVEGAYLDAAFDQLRRDYGSVEAYLDKELGIGPAELAALKRRMLTQTTP